MQQVLNSRMANIAALLITAVCTVYILVEAGLILIPLMNVSFLWFAAGLLVSLWIIQFIGNNLITPCSVGSRVRLNPMVALIAILIGGSIWGISGMILFLPLVGTLKALFDEIEGLKPYGLLLGSSGNRKTE